MQPDTRNVLDLLIQHERAIARLYLRFATAFGTRQEFWQKLAAEEHMHAKKLETLRTSPGLDRWLSSADRVKPQAIRSSIDYVETQASRAAEGGLTLLQALAVAKDIEGALIDSQLLLPVPPGPGALSMILKELRADTEGHRRVVAEMLETEKGARS